MDVEEIHRWFPPEKQQPLVSRLAQRVGVTRVRAECFVRLWIYLAVQTQRSQNPDLKPPLPELLVPQGAQICTHREAAELFYSDKDQGSDRAAGLMLDKLAALGLIRKSFDGNTTTLEIQPLPELVAKLDENVPVDLRVDDFAPRTDAIPIANLLAANYNWMNANRETLPHRIARLLRGWASQYPVGMRVLRRCDTLNPVGFYLLYPTASASEALFFSSPNKGLHLSTLAEVDPFILAAVGDRHCVSVFVRSWMIAPPYLKAYRVPFLQDVQQTLGRMQQDFPNLCDIHTLIIHPSYEALASALGFQKTHRDFQTSLYWMYLPLDRFLALDVATAIADAFGQQDAVAKSIR